MNTKYKLIVISIFGIFLLSGCIAPQQQKTIVNKTYEVVSVNQFYISGNMFYSINYVDESGTISVLTEGSHNFINDAIHVVEANETKLVYDYYDSNSRYSTLYLNISNSGINGKNSEYTVNCGKACTRTVDVTVNKVY